MIITVLDIHESLCGLLAGKLLEVYKKPAIVFTRTSEGLLKGSGRSVDTFDMFKAIDKRRNLLVRFGGHPKACGLSLLEENFDSFCEALYAEEFEKESDDISIDLFLPLHHLSSQFVRDLSLLEPFGEGNREPVIADKGITIKSVKRIGKQKNYFRVSLLSSNGQLMDGVVFKNAEEFEALLRENFSGTESLDLTGEFCPSENTFRLAICYTPQINSWNGQERLQVVIQNFDKSK